VFTKTKDTETRASAEYQVTLGVMPDYTFSGQGLKIDGVIGGRPAEKAGLKAGDILIRLGDVEVGNIYDYMDGLAKFNEGDEVTVVVKRGEETIRTTVIF
jgi:aminopeptidase YwaD